MSDTELGNFAANILDAYSRRIARNDIDALLYMTVGSRRLKLLSDLTRRIDAVLKLSQPERLRQGGAYFEGVLGDFGCGKSHVGYLLQHNALRARTEMLVAHCQITGEMRFPYMLAAVLRSLRLSGVDSVVGNHIELSAYRRLAEWAGGNQAELESFIREHLLNLPLSAAVELAAAIKAAARPQPDGSLLQAYLSKWVERNEPRAALTVFEQVLRLFNRLQVKRVCLIIDEFEALSALPEQELKETLQHLQSLHDDFASAEHDLPSLYAVFLSTDDFWKLGSAKMPSLLRAGDRVRQTSDIPNISKLEIVGLMERYMTLFLLSEKTYADIDYERFLQACDECWAELAGRTHHMRSVHSAVRSKVESLFFSAARAVAS